MLLGFLGDPAILVCGRTQRVKSREMRPRVGDADPALVGVPARPTGGLGHDGVGYLSRSAETSTACAAASRATGTRNGEHET